MHGSFWVGKDEGEGKGWVEILSLQGINCHLAAEKGIAHITWTSILENIGFKGHVYFYWGFSGGSDGKDSACNEGGLGSILGSGRSPGEGMATHSSTLDGRIPWIEEPGGCKESDSVTNTFTYFYYHQYLRSY